MGSLFSAPKAPKTQMPAPTVPAKPEVESAEDLSKMIKRGGRAQTVSAGLLQSSDDYNVGKRTLLG